MPRVKRGTGRRDYRKKTLERASGFFLTKSKLNRAAQEAVEKAQKYAYVGRKQKKRLYRSLWIVRIGAASTAAGLSYSKFMHGLKLAGIELDRKVLAAIAYDDTAAFNTLVAQASDALKAAPRTCTGGIMPQVDQEVDSLAGLEDRIMKAVQLVGRLRQEKEAALQENHRLTEELEALRSERKQVRGRIEKLLGHIDTLGQ